MDHPMLIINMSFADPCTTCHRGLRCGCLLAGPAIFALLITIAGPVAAAQLNIAVTLSDVLPIVRTIGGDCVTAQWVMPPGSDPHSFSLSARLHRRLTSADLIAYAKSDFLSFEADVKDALGEKPAVDWPDYAEHGARLKSFPGWNNSPHGFWLDHENAAAIAQAVAAKVKQLGADAKATDANLASFLGELEALRGTTQAMAEANDAADRTYVAAIPGVAYSIANLDMQVGSVLLNEGAGFASGAALKQITDRLRSGQYSAIVCPLSMKQAKPGEIARQLSRDVGASVIYIHFLSETEWEASYLAQAYYNASALTQRLDSGQAANNGASPVYAAMAIGIPCLIVILVLAVKILHLTRGREQRAETGGIFDD